MDMSYDSDVLDAAMSDLRAKTIELKALHGLYEHRYMTISNMQSHAWAVEVWLDAAVVVHEMIIIGRQVTSNEDGRMNPQAADLIFTAKRMQVRLTEQTRRLFPTRPYEDFNPFSGRGRTTATQVDPHDLIEHATTATQTIQEEANVPQVEPAETYSAASESEEASGARALLNYSEPLGNTTNTPAPSAISWYHEVKEEERAVEISNDATDNDDSAPGPAPTSTEQPIEEPDDEMRGAQSRPARESIPADRLWRHYKLENAHLSLGSLRNSWEWQHYNHFVQELVENHRYGPDCNVRCPYCYCYERASTYRHDMFKCNAFRELERYERVLWVDCAMLCHNCFSPRHETFECDKANGCTCDTGRCQCGIAHKHNSLLCGGRRAYDGGRAPKRFTGPEPDDPSRRPLGGRSNFW